jgi:CHAD domain-containing protein
MRKTLDLRDHLKELIDEGRVLNQSLQESFTPKGVHKFRVCMRRIRTMLSLLPEESILPPDKKFLKKLWHRLGEVRDVDVARDLSDELDFSTKKLKKERVKARAKLRHLLLQRETNSFFDHLERLTLRQDAGTVDPLPAMRKLRTSLLQTPAEPKHLHSLRITLKKIRYLREALELPVNDFKTYQDIFGAFQDIAVYRERHPHSHRVHDEYVKRKEEAIHSLKPAFTFALKALAQIESEFGEEMGVRRVA